MIINLGREGRSGTPRLASLTLFCALCAGAAAPLDADDRVLTNLGLLDRLTEEAVREAIDSLGVEAGGSYAIVPREYHEGNRFVADVFARVLTSRGCEVQLLESVSTEASSETKPGSLGTEEPRAPGGAGEEEDEEDLGLLEDFFAAEDSFAPDSAEAAADSVDWIALADSLAQVAAEQERGEAAAGEEAPEGEQAEPAGEASEAARRSPAGTPAAERPAEKVTVPRGYPPGKILEFRILEFGVGYPTVKRSLGLVGSPTVRRLGGVYLQTARIRGPEGKIEAMATGQSHREDLLDNRARLRAEGASYPFSAPEVPAARIGKLVEPIVVVGIISSLVYLFYQNQN